MLVRMTAGSRIWHRVTIALCVLVAIGVIVILSCSAQMCISAHSRHPVTCTVNGFFFIVLGRLGGLALLPLTTSALFYVVVSLAIIIGVWAVWPAKHLTRR
jgi:hypothetical protein